MNLIGVDPGAEGGIAVIFEKEGKVAPHAFPKSERDTWELVYGQVARQCLGTHTRAVIEKVNAFPGQGVKSMFSFGKSFGFLRACLIAGAIPFEEVQPSKWQRDLGCLNTSGLTKAEHKRELVELAKQLYPGVPVRPETADALLLAEWLRRREKGAA